MADNLQGTVKWFSKKKGFGFITKQDGVDLFMHITSVVDNKLPKDGDIVTFTEGVGKGDRLAAEQVKVIKRVGGEHRSNQRNHRYQRNANANKSVGLLARLRKVIFG